MISEIERAIIALAKRINGETKSDDAMRYTQATLNMAHVLAVIKRETATPSE